MRLLTCFFYKILYDGNRIEDELEDSRSKTTRINQC